MLPKLYVLQHPQLARLASDALGALCGSDASQLGARPLARLLATILGKEEAWNVRDANSIISLVQLLGAGFAR